MLMDDVDPLLSDLDSYDLQSVHGRVGSRQTWGSAGGSQKGPRTATCAPIISTKD